MGGAEKPRDSVKQVCRPQIAVSEDDLGVRMEDVLEGVSLGAKSCDFKISQAWKIIVSNIPYDQSNHNYNIILSKIKNSIIMPNLSELWLVI